MTAELDRDGYSKQASAAPVGVCEAPWTPARSTAGTDAGCRALAMLPGRRSAPYGARLCPIAAAICMTLSLPAAAKSVGDFNNDGFDDLAVGAPNEDILGNSIEGAGLVNVIYGSDDGLADSADLRAGPLRGGTVSVTTAKAMTEPISRPRTVTIGMRMLRKAWTKTTRAVDSPFALANLI